jgi:hypothetical protein
MFILISHIFKSRKFVKFHHRGKAMLLKLRDWYMFIKTNKNYTISTVHLKYNFMLTGNMGKIS